MKKQIQDLFKKAYSAFNARDIDTALSTMHPDGKHSANRIL